jgi:hypothetical protein
MNDTITDWLEGLYGIKVDSVTAIVTLAVIGATVILFESMFSFRNHFDPKGKVRDLVLLERGTVGGVG